MGTYAAAKAAFEGMLAAYNRALKPMALVLFDDALDHLLRLHRTLSLPQVRGCADAHAQLSLTLTALIYIHSPCKSILRRIYYRVLLWR